MVKCTLLQALRLCTDRKAHRGSRGIALLFLDHSTRRGEGSASRPGRSLPPGKTRCPLYRRLCGPQGRSAQVRKISLPPGFDPRTVQPVASRYTDYLQIGLLYIFLSNTLQYFLSLFSMSLQFVRSFFLLLFLHIACIYQLSVNALYALSVSL